MFDIGNTNKISFIFCMCFLGVLSAFKSPTIGNDTTEYIRLYELGKKILTDAPRYEIGFKQYCYHLYLISDNSQFLFITTSIIVFGIYGWFMWKYSKIPWFSILIFFAFGTFGFVMSGLRQSIAMAITLIAFHFLLRKCMYTFLSLIACAVLFHTSAIIFVICPILLGFKIEKVSVYLLISIALLVYFAYPIILQYGFQYLIYYEHYKEGVYFEGETRLASIIQLLFAILIFSIGYTTYTKKRNLINTSFEHKLFQALLNIHFFAILLHVLCLRFNLIDRFALYYSSFSIISLPLTVSLMNLKTRKIIVTSILVIMYFYSTLILILRPNWNSVFPYSFCFE